MTERASSHSEAAGGSDGSAVGGAAGGAGRIAAALDLVGSRLRRVRGQRGLTLTEAAALAGMSKSTLSRLETGQRKPSLELLLPLAQTYRVPLDDLVGAPEVGDPRIIGDQDLVLGTGEAAEFDTEVPHWFGSTGDGPAEVLSIFGRPGERMLVRASGQDALDGPSEEDPHPE